MKLTTLIIGFRTPEGIGLVSDTKVSISNGESFHQSKILTPIQGVPVIVGAAGDADLFLEFNRKVPLIVNEKIRQINIDNEAELKTVGLSLKDYQQPQESRNQQNVKKEISKIKETKKEFIQPPYMYSGEDLIDDCKNLIKGISSQVKNENPFPLEMFLGLKGDITAPPSLHYINWNGRERAIRGYEAIGSGSAFVKKFFDKHWNFGMSLADSISLAFFTIKYVQDVAKDIFVGVEDNELPEAFVVYNDGNFGRIRFSNENDVLKKINEKTKHFQDMINQINLTEMKLIPKI